LTAATLVEGLAAEGDLELELFATGPVSLQLTDRPPIHVPSSSGAPLGAAAFDQIHFPRAASRSGADVLLILHPSAPIAAVAPAVTWYGDGQRPESKGRRESRLGRSLARAGMRGAAAVLRPADLPADTIDVRWIAVPPSIPAAFFAGPAAPVAPAPLQLPEAFVLAVCESPEVLPLLLAAWTWVESSLGDLYMLVLAASDEEGRISSQRAAEQRGLTESVCSIVLGDEDWPGVIHRAATLLHGGTRRNAAALRWALAGGLPVAAPATPVSESIVGPAGYLVSPESRALGAACLTLLVEEEIAASLRAKGRERAGAYRPEVAATAWAEILRKAATSRVRRSPLARSR
jgi:hypothetical protein